MPELPEVETVRRGLAPVMEGQVIARAQVNRPDLRWPFPPDMAARLTGARVLMLRRRSKYLLADLDRGEGGDDAFALARPGSEADRVHDLDPAPRGFPVQGDGALQGC